ncbi:MAG: tetratricopeptide repeat protein, partial [Leptolyngbyaceae cyanobacterium RU_5_1]|nr:tetratricopeptide repeat protein [Leptolyngbyaceae cyanobacterium RU_5_1]
MLRRSLGVFVVLVCLLGLLGHPSAFAIGWGGASFSARQPVTASADLVFPDYQQRSQIISSYEQQVHQSPDSFLLLRLLAAQYLRRFRETGDVDDLRRTEQAARQSLTIQPRHNQAAELLLGSALLSQHRFQEALQVVTAAQQSAPDDANLALLKASVLMELGDYEAAQPLLQTTAIASGTSGESAVAARYLELTGDLHSARKRLDSSLQQMDTFYSAAAETRAWLHVRAGDLAFMAGELSLAEQRYREAIALFPDDIAAFTGLARVYAAQHRWQQVLEVANQGIDRIPLVETLGYKADAQRALGDSDGASATEALIEVVGHLSKVQGLYDRALAIYYADHGIHVSEALEIARRELAVRDDIYAEDTLAWAAAANGQWQVAQQAAQRATRYGTEDALLHFHHGMIALHCGDRDQAISQLRKALQLNPWFHHTYADEARHVLAELAPQGGFIVAKDINEGAPLLHRR